MSRTFVASAAPEGWQLGRWSQVSESTWEETKESGETYTYEDAGASETPGSTTVRLRLQTDRATTEVLIVDKSIQVCVDGTYFGEYLGSWAEGLGREGSVAGSAPTLPRRISRQNSNMTELSMSKSVVSAMPAQKRPNCDETPAMVERLYQAAKAGDEQEVTQLLLHPVDPDGVSPSENLTPLIAAVSCGKPAVKIVQQLLQFGADVNKDCGGQTAMIAAYQRGKKDVLRALFAATFTSLHSTIGGGSRAPSLWDTKLHTVVEDEDVDCLDHVRDLKEVTTKLAKVHHTIKHDTTSPNASLKSKTKTPLAEYDSDAQREQNVRQSMRALLSASHGHTIAAH
jgi:hypothetical protein